MKRSIHLLLVLAVFTYGYTSAAEKPEMFVQLGHQKTVGSASFSLDGKYLATGSEDQTVKLWDVASGSEIRTFSGHTKEVKAVAVSFGGGLVVSGDISGVIKLWNAQTGQEIKSIQGHEKEVALLSFAPDNKMLTSVALDSTMKSWSVATGQLIKTTTDVRGLPFLTSGNRFVAVNTSDFKRFSLLDISNASEIGAFNARTGFVISAAFSGDGRYALLMDDDYAQQKKSLEFIDVAANKRIAIWNTEKDTHYTALSPDGSRALSAGVGGLKMWDTFNGRELKSLTADFTTFAFFRQMAIPLSRPDFMPPRYGKPLRARLSGLLCATP